MTRRQTLQKLAVLNAVRNAQPAHPTAADIFTGIRPLLPSLSFATVYRVLHRLAEDGAIRAVPQSGGPTRYDGNIEFHHHVLCSMCDSLGDVHLSPDFLISSCICPQTEFQINGYRLEFHGLCPSCSNNVRQCSSRGEKGNLKPC